MIRLGLTGSIGMGKSTTAAMFAARGVPVFDADRAVHRLYAGPLAGDVERLFPGTVVAGAVDRVRLAAALRREPDGLARLEALVHPAVRAAEADFSRTMGATGAPLMVLDIPLLFETGRHRDVDRVAVVSAPADVQRRRVLARPGMTAERFASLLARQMPDADKRRRADVVIPTGDGLEAARAVVTRIIADAAIGSIECDRCSWQAPDHA